MYDVRSVNKKEPKIWIRFLDARTWNEYFLQAMPSKPIYNPDDSKSMARAAGILYEHKYVAIRKWQGFPEGAKKHISLKVTHHRVCLDE